MQIFRIFLAVLISFSTALTVSQRVLSETEITSEENGNSLPGNPIPLSRFCVIPPQNFSTSRFIPQHRFPFYLYTLQEVHLSDIAKQYASIGDYEQAAKALELIKPKTLKVDTLVTLAESYLQKGEQKLAVDAASQALNIIVESIVGSDQDDFSEQTYFYDIAKIYLQAADSYLEVEETKLASEILSLASQTIRKLEGQILKEDLLSQLASQLVIVGKQEEALTIAASLDKEVRDNTLVQIGINLASLGQFEQAMEIAERLRKENAYSEKSQSIIIANIAHKYINQGEAILAIGTVQNIEDFCTRSKAFSELSSLLLETEKYDSASQVADIIEEPFIKNNTLRTVAMKLVQQEKYEQAIAIIQGLQYRDSNNKADALIEIAENLIEAGKPEQASELLAQALEITQSLPAQPAIPEVKSPQPNN